MKRTLLIIGLAVQLTASAVLAQATVTTTADTTTETSTGMFGRDWSTSMGTALMGEDGMTVRSADEIGTQYDTLSDLDKDMLRRDCMVHMQTSGAADGTVSSDVSGEIAPSGRTAVEGSASTKAVTEGSVTTSLTAAQMDQICAATKDK